MLDEGGVALFAFVVASFLTVDADDPAADDSTARVIEGMLITSISVMSGIKNHQPPS